MNNEIDRLQGVWDIVSLEMDGHTMSAGALGGASITIQGNEFTSTGMGSTYEGRIEVDATAVPSAFNLHFSNGPEKGNTNLGIYELIGDTWRICLATRSTTRPKKFAAEPGTGVVVEVLNRRKEATAPHPVATAPATTTPADLPGEFVGFEPAPELEGEWSMISGSFDGQPLDKNFVKLAKREVEGTDMSVTFGKDVYSKGKYTVDRSTTPIAIDIHNTAGANRGKMQRGIYDLQGKTLMLSIAAVGRERPGDFTSTPGDGRAVVIWKKA